MRGIRGLEYKIKHKNEDFEVTEIPWLPPVSIKSDSSYSYIWLKKSGWTTFNTQEELASHFGINLVDINFEGLKDEDAVTRQVISVKKLLNWRDIASFNSKYNITNNCGMEIEKILGFGREPVKEKILHGNSFKIVIRSMKTGVAFALRDFFLRHHFVTFVNYYDNQRFGMVGGPYNTHLIGKSLIKGKWRLAFSEFVKTANFTQVEKNIWNRINGRNKYKEFFMSLNPKRLSFFIASYNSFLWNKKASSDLNILNKGRRYKFPNIGMLFLPSDRNFQSFNTCSLNGFVFMESSGQIESRPFTRSLTVTTTVFAGDLEKDDLHKNKWKTTLSFFLPPGSYATMLIKQIFIRSFNDYEKKHRGRSKRAHQ